ncbi:single-stranded DNA-binding protein [Sporosarcina sp. P21c]|uniref:single-stranded DNA-binding protein n=1 Tax=Sporosarcina TaxID=1569 RepID=UPI000A14A3CE|nr:MULTISPECIES: single-stranded DNA-binding protein [Sporosarcina]PIC67950.1 single-stranded DNA-binding protein [Sporosarcina sp. P16a]PIC82411.1 single-stranded DNA-binding protein [Sporosarcina sp. P1]PIC90862.1 single-stranded DNA-binding protein [Sporosarcina sp. P21c]PIC94259.1 single-stranded DNA-binding protein [Sporosarcina sp. P25]
MNQVALVGRITKDLVLKEHSSGRVNTTFALAVNRSFKNANGEIATDFVPCSVWGRSAENLVRHCGKGSLVGVSGSIQTRNYEREDRSKVYIMEVMCSDIRFLSKSSKPQQAEMKTHSSTEPERFEEAKSTETALPIF